MAKDTADRPARTLRPRTATRAADDDDTTSTPPQNETAAERRAREGMPDEEEPIDARIAAPGRRHQPTKESGLGTPSADARPGASSFGGPLGVDDAITNDQFVERAQERAASRTKVQATRTGYYGEIRRRPGDVFFIDDPEHFSKLWMRNVPDKTPLTGSTPNEAIRKKHDEILGARTSGRRSATADETNPIDAD